jgi:rare lipoprotein A
MRIVEPFRGIRRIEVMEKLNHFAEPSKETYTMVSKTFRELQQTEISTEERIRQRVRSSVRIVIASALFCIGGIASLTASAGEAFAHRTKHHTHDSATKHHHSARSRRHLKHVAARGNAYINSLTKAAEHIQNKGITGLASWYGGKFQSRKTASGETYDQHSMTAAHRSLPFGTMVRVTNTLNQKSCIVKITDRGPYVGKRIIDLSYAAATELGFVNLGTANVRLEIIGSLAQGFSNTFGLDPVLASLATK